MKRLINIITGCLFLVLISCEDEDTAGVSRVTFYPQLTMHGEQYMSVEQGGAYVEEGVDATEKGEPIEVKISGEVDINTPGIYKIAYSATNVDGFDATVIRYVAVVAEDVADVDIAGTYMRASNSRLSTVTKLASGFFYMTDVWGTASSGGNPLAVNSYLFLTSSTTLEFEYNETGAPFGGNFGTGTIEAGTGNLILNTTLNVGANRVNTWLKQ